MSKTTRDDAMLAMGQIHGILIGISLTSRHDDEQRATLAARALCTMDTVFNYLKDSVHVEAMGQYIYSPTEPGALE